MAEDSAAESLGKIALGGAVGFALYLLVTGLGLGGRGRGEGRGGGRGESTFPAPSVPKDNEPLLYVVTHPVSFEQEASKLPKLPDPTARARRDARFRRLDLGTTEVSPDELSRRMSELLRRERDERVPPITLDELIERVKAGGRDDVRLLSPGSIRAGTWDDVKDALMAAGIRHWLLWREWPSDRRPGDLPKQPRWDLYGKVATVGNPDKAGHHLVTNMGTALWNLSREVGGKDPAPHVSGDVGRGHYR